MKRIPFGTHVLALAIGKYDTLVRKRGPKYIRKTKQASQASKPSKQAKQAKQSKQTKQASKQAKLESVALSRAS